MNKVSNKVASNRVRVGILGATGMVGQRFVQLLANHPGFVLTALAASPADQEKLATANTAFAFDLLKQIVKEQPDTNVFISPFSVSTALQMVANGAAGGTKVEMQRVLKTTGLPAE